MYDPAIVMPLPRIAQDRTKFKFLSNFKWAKPTLHSGVGNFYEVRN